MICDDTPVFPLFSRDGPQSHRARRAVRGTARPGPSWRYSPGRHATPSLPIRVLRREPSPPSTPPNHPLTTTAIGPPTVTFNSRGLGPEQAERAGLESPPSPVSARVTAVLNDGARP
ncbi:unnamed protein product [Arctogadus glacialis]